MRILFLVIFLLASFSARADDECRRPDVDHVTFPVTLSDGKTYNEVGFLYRHRGVAERDLQVTIHGATDQHLYWDIPDLNGRAYSYVNFMVCRGYDILALDSLGAGQSDKPPGDFLNTNETVSSLNQVIQQVKRGIRHRHLYVVGHSFGAEQAVLLQARFNNPADAIVLSGWGHTLTPLPPCGALDLSMIYIQPFPIDQTACFFFYLPQTDPDMLPLDHNVLGSTISRGQFLDVLTFFNNRLLDMAGAVRNPVLVQFGEFDALYPGPVEGANNGKTEASFFPNSRRVDVKIIPNIGHR